MSSWKSGGIDNHVGKSLSVECKVRLWGCKDKQAYFSCLCLTLLSLTCSISFFPCWWDCDNVINKAEYKYELCTYFSLFWIAMPPEDKKKLVFSSFYIIGNMVLETEPRFKVRRANFSSSFSTALDGWPWTSLNWVVDFLSAQLRTIPPHITRRLRNSKEGPVKQHFVNTEVWWSSVLFIPIRKCYWQALWFLRNLAFIDMVRQATETNAMWEIRSKNFWERCFYSSN